MSTDNVSQARHSTEYLVLIALPGSIIGVLATALFVGFVSDQASEIAKLIRDIEYSCHRVGFGQLGLMPAAAVTAADVATCREYWIKVALFYLLTIVWCTTAFVATANLGQALRSEWGRYTLSLLVAVSVPLIITAKYWFDGQQGDYFNPPKQGELTAIPFFMIALFVLLVAIFYFIGLPDKTSRRRTYDNAVRVMFWSAIVVFVGVSLVFAWYEANLYDRIGSINLIMLFVILLYVFLAGLFHYSRTTGAPVAALFLGYLIIVTAFGGPEFSRPRELSSDLREETQPLQKAERQLLGWLKSRDDYEKFELADKTYPIYIVASAGGGIYAAMRSAFYLRVLQQNCPTFLHHV